MLQGTIFYMGGWSTLKKDAAHCYLCRMFGSSTNRPEKASFDWKHAAGSKGMLLSHNNCISHKQSVV